MIKAIIFDFAGVISNEAYWDWLSENFEIDQEKKAHFSEISRKVDKAEISEAEFVNILSEDSGKKPEDVRNEILSIIKIRPEVITMVSKAKGKYKVGMLTNYCKEWMDYLRKKHSLDAMFDAVVVSSELKIIKPEKGIYLEISKRLGVPTNECIFIDDRKPNIDGAKACGMKGIVFSSTEQVKKDLNSHGIYI
jgi:epoxide hydrolase-like predicted phosphatase